MGAPSSCTYITPCTLKLSRSEYRLCQDTEGTYLTSFSVTVLISFEKQYVYRPSFSAVTDAVPSDSLRRLCSAMFMGSDSCGHSHYGNTLIVRRALTQKSISRCPPPPT